MTAENLFQCKWILDEDSRSGNHFNRLSRRAIFPPVFPAAGGS
jgi:hypothetical protein